MVMARIARVVVPGYPHHVTQRGNRRQAVFFGGSARFCGHETELAFCKAFPIFSYPGRVNAGCAPFSRRSQRFLIENRAARERAPTAVFRRCPFATSCQPSPSQLRLGHSSHVEEIQLVAIQVTKVTSIEIQVAILSGTRGAVIGSTQ